MYEMGKSQKSQAEFQHHDSTDSITESMLDVKFHVVYLEEKGYCMEEEEEEKHEVTKDLLLSPFIYNFPPG